MKRTVFGDLAWVSTLIIITAFLFLPQTHHIFIELTSNRPYLMGFIKFGILATMGELLALRLANRVWKIPTGLFLKIVIWGLIGVLITFMFSFYSAGVSALREGWKISPENWLMSKLLPAFLTSLIMNLTFGVVFMGMHRMSDTYIEIRSNRRKPSLMELVQVIDWDSFISFVVFKTIPLFWIPAHTITFLLPSYYRVVVAAYLSIILGVILTYSNKAKKETAIKEDVID